jgi:GAF domain-containing protein
MSCQIFLELLAREAAAVEFEGPLIEARSRGESAETIAALDQARLVALRVRALLEHRRRREAELSGLFETANDLVALRDVDSVLLAIVHRARRLLGTDVAYLTLNDEDRGDTYMRVTDGSISARFQTLRLPMGAGLGGLVAQTAMPYASAGYARDERFRHTDEIDVAVREEGLVAILGVPLLLGSRVLGVLFAANRGARPFTREETALLASFAAHAAVALDSARLLAEMRTALEELNTANELVKAHSEAVERAAAAHDRITEVVLRGGGVADIAAAVTDVLGGGLLVLDSAGGGLAAIGPVAGARPADIEQAVAASRTTGRAAARGTLWAAAVVAGSEYLGALVLVRETELVEADQRMLERAALVTALLLLFRRTVADAEGRVRGELLDDLLSARPHDPAALRERAGRLGVDLAAPHAVVVARPSGGDPERTAFSALHFASTHGALSLVRAGEAVLVVPGEAPERAARQIAQDLTAALGHPVTAGAAGPASGPEQFAAAYREATRCLETLIALGRIGDGASAAELGFVGLLLGESRDVTGFLTKTIGPVVEYDRRRGSALVETLEAYFGHGGSLARAAETLHVHVNTVAQRLDRIAQLLGADWQRPERALEVQLALRLHRLS